MLSRVYMKINRCNRCRCSNAAGVRLISRHSFNVPVTLNLPNERPYEGGWARAQNVSGKIPEKNSSEVGQRAQFPGREEQQMVPTLRMLRFFFVPGTRHASLPPAIRGQAYSSSQVKPDHVLGFRPIVVNRVFLSARSTREK